MKKGFTLIELMVVIVIIGILAAIAVPKMFGMSAKAKASEVSPAAGTYAKLQQAFFAEIAQIGPWVSIGYDAPGKQPDGSGTTNNFNYTEPAAGSWQAAAKVDLNNCKIANGIWTMTTDAASGVSQAGGAGTTDTDCNALIPNFTQIGK